MPVGPLAPVLPTPGPSYQMPPVSSGPTVPYSPTVNVNVDWSDVDILDFGIDILGIIGDGAKSIGMPGAITYGISEVAEVGGLVKSAHDVVFTQDVSNFSMIVFEKQLEESLPILFPDAARLAPNFGVIFNVISISQNMPSITITAR